MGVLFTNWFYNPYRNIGEGMLVRNSFGNMRHGGNLSPSIAIVTILCALTLVFSLSACERPGRPSATTDDYVGIWACYSSRVNKDYTYYELGKGINQYLVIYKDGRAYEVVTNDGANAIARESQWYKTQADKRTGEDHGIVLVGDQYENPYVYYDAGEDTHFVGERLVKGNFSLHYGDTSYYFEKLSNDPDDSKWLPMEIATTNASKPDSSSEPETSRTSSSTIEWTEASSHIGETVTVRGPVVAVNYAEESKGSPTFIDIGAAYPDASRVTIVIWGEDRNNFAYPPETISAGETLDVTGEIYPYEGACYIKATSHTQIEPA